MKKKIAIYGCGGFAREVAPILQQNYMLRYSAKPAQDFIVFVSDHKEQYEVKNNIAIIDYQELLSKEHREREIIISVADPITRKKLVGKVNNDSFKFTSCVASSHKTLGYAEIGEAAILCDNTLITADVKIGKHFHCNIYSYVAHDCIIGDYVTFAPRVNCNGNTVIHNKVYIGTGAVLRAGTPSNPLIIGEGAVIGMGAVVTKNVEPYSVVYGNPATVKKKQAIATSS